MSPLQGHQLSELLGGQSHLDTATFFHVGLLVPDLDEAVKNYGRLLGLTFAGPQTVTVPRFEEPGHDGPLDVRVAFSQQGPPYYELLEKAGQGFYGTEQPDGLNHVGVWVKDVEDAAQEIERLGLQREATQYDDEGRVLVAFFRPGDLLGGLRLELVPEWRREGFEKWLSGREIYT